MRYFIYLSYDGKSYHGWQIQPNGCSIQEVVQDRLSTLLRKKIDIVGAGRTDAGVNANEMVAHFDYSDIIDCKLLQRKINKFLPRDIFVYKIVGVKPDAHARFDAISRTYKYYISSSKNPFFRHYTFFMPHSLDYNRMNLAANCLFEYEDFTSFSKLHTDTKTNNCRIKEAYWQMSPKSSLINSSHTEVWEFTIQADRFLRNMVRAIVGTLIDVGRCVLDIDDFRRIIEEKDRCRAGMSVPGHALFLHKVEYPDNIFLA